MGNKKKLTLELTAKDGERLEEMLRSGVESVRVIKRAQTLRLLGKGKSSLQVAGSVSLTPKAVRQIGRRYQEGGLARALYEKPRPGAARLLSESEEQRIIAMVCTPSPSGRARWTVRLIAAEAVKRKVVPQVGRETIRVLLERHELKPWREKNVVYRRTGRGVHRPDGRRSGCLRAAFAGRRTGALSG